MVSRTVSENSLDAELSQSRRGFRSFLAIVGMSAAEPELRFQEVHNIVQGNRMDDLHILISRPVVM